MGIKKIHVPGCGCCGCVCDACQDSLSPSQFQVALTGISNNSPVQCDQCTNLSATHTLSFYFCGASAEISHIGNYCEWRSAPISAGSHGADPCTYYVVLHVIKATATAWRLHVYITPDGSFTNRVKLWQKNYAAPPPCSTLSGEVITHNSAAVAGKCNWAVLGATCQVTAL